MTRSVPGFFIPHRYADRAVARAYPHLEALFGRAAPGFGRLLATATDHTGMFTTFCGPAPEPRWDQDWFARLDGAIAYTLVRSLRPRRIVEIGSGHSTRFMARAVRDGACVTTITCIDPAPRAALQGLSVAHLACDLQSAPLEIFAELSPGDILFIDSSHVAMPGSDVDLLFNLILPELPSGTLLHIHDTFLPDPYPEAWAWRGYNEQLLTAAWISGGGIEPVFSSRYVTSRMPEALAASPIGGIPLLPGAYECSFWARRC
jgi:predicted O-methyltransferase YrrM